jgi:signal transduction histidine kinase
MNTSALPIAERHRAEEALNRLNRELRAISKCNQVLVRAEDERTLLDEICRIVCDEAGYRMAWVGHPGNDQAKTVWPVAWAGVEEDYLALAGLTWADTERGRGPAGTAIRSGRTDCSQDIATDPRIALWRENALQRGYRSIIAMPLKDENKTVFGVFLIYSTEPNAFTPNEIRLLEELADDLAFGIQALHNRNARREAEESLHLQTVELEEEVAERQKARETLEEQALQLENEMDERRTAQAELEILNENLERRVSERTAKLEQANLRLQELDRMKSMFIASMSHELRTPLNSVIGFSRILHNEWLGPLNGGQKENLATILRSGKLLLTLINDIIDVSKIEAGMIEAVIEDFDVYDVVSEAMTTFENDLRDKGVRLTVQGIHRIMQTDRTRLLQCLLNLVSNAVKFTERGRITICAEIPEGSDKLEISVTDTGIGIGEEDLDKIYSPFVRLDSPLKTTVPGTGLGLYLTRKLVKDLLCGDITVTSTPGTGSRFVLTVPINL